MDKQQYTLDDFGSEANSLHLEMLQSGLENILPPRAEQNWFKAMAFLALAVAELKQGDYHRMKGE